MPCPRFWFSDKPEKVLKALNLLIFVFQTFPDIKISLDGKDVDSTSMEPDKRYSRTSDYSSTYSSSMQLSINEGDSDDEDSPANQTESVIDSDEEEGLGDSTEVCLQSLFACVRKRSQEIVTIIAEALPLFLFNIVEVGTEKIKCSQFF